MTRQKLKAILIAIIIYPVEVIWASTRSLAWIVKQAYQVMYKIVQFMLAMIVLTWLFSILLG